MVQQGLAAQVIDEMTISIIPILLGSGISLFSGQGPRNDLDLISSKSFPSGLVQVKYRLRD